MRAALEKRTQQCSQKVLLDCVVEDSESAKQKTTEWQPGSDQAQFGITTSNKFFFINKIFMGASQQPNLAQMPTLT
ncbi:hypothetical protein [Nostoc piscinale]|uniref:hypothetical protein n=1 Tax=Nostoc piscinale TaxID=224012 RepID=UPI001396655D|nr:hypothetical protein [Nostoc piscinale]